MSDLLAAEYRVYFRNRYTKQITEGCDLSRQTISGVFRRVLSGVSTADLAWQVGDGCCDCYPQKAADELVIDRIGKNGDHRAWVGPVTEVRRDTDTGLMEIEASDRAWWWTRRQSFQRAIQTEGLDAAEAWKLVRADQDRIDPAGLDVRFRPVGRAVDVDVVENGDIDLFLLDFTDVEWTVIGETLYGPGPDTVGEIPFGSFDTDRDWDTNGDGTGGPTVIDTAENTASAVVVAGLDVIGQWPADPIIGPSGFHLARVDRPDLITQADVDDLARELFERNRTGGLFISTKSSSLKRGGQFTVADLIPGRRFTVETDVLCSDEPIVATVELAQIVVRFATDPGSSRTVETGVAVDMQPVGVSFPVEELTVV